MDEVVLSDNGDFCIFVGPSKAYVSIHIVAFKSSFAVLFYPCLVIEIFYENYDSNMKYYLLINSFSSMYDHANPLRILITFVMKSMFG